jgi:AcrR family transcriptional regulator
MTYFKSAPAPGKLLIIKAALQLAVHTRSIRALGVREIGRQAGLNPNTFYRHFKDMDDLGLAILDQVVGELRPQLHELRLKTAQAILSHAGATAADATLEQRAMGIKAVVEEMVRHFFDFVLKNQEAFILGVSELHGASPVLRKALRDVIETFTADKANDIVALNLLPQLTPAQVSDISATFVYRMFYWSAEFIERPERRPQIIVEANQMMTWLIAGAVAVTAASQPDS